MTFAHVISRLTPGRPMRFIVPLSLLVALGCMLICSMLLLDNRRTASRQAMTAAANIASTVARDVARNIELYDLSLQAVAHGMALPGIGSLEPELRRMILFDRAAYARHFGFMNVLNEAGDVVIDSLTATPRPANYASRDYFQAQRNDPQDTLFIGRPFLTSPGQPATIPLSRRLSYPDGRFAGVVVGTIRLAYFHDLFSHLALGAHGTITLLRSDGVTLMQAPFAADDIGRSLPPGSPVVRAQAGGLRSITWRNPGDGIPREYIVQPVDNLPLVVTVGVAQPDLDAPWLVNAVAVLTVLAVLCLANAGLAVLVRTSVSRREQAEVAARQATAESGRFLATISHDLRTPLASVLGYAELMTLDEDLSPDQAARLASLISAAEHTRDVVDRVLEVTRPDSRANQPRLQDTDLGGLLSGCRAMIEPAAAAKRLHLSCSIASTLPRRVMIDGAQVREVLLNLLGNAVKYTDRGGIEVSFDGDAHRLQCEVGDTGPGIPASQRSRLFQAYDRLDAHRRGIEGFGLGLASAARLVTGMAGRIGYRDNPGGGSIFWFEIPIAPAAPAAAPEVAEEDQPPHAPRRILLADDAAMSRDVAICFLRAAGHSVEAVADGDEALEVAAEEDFDLVMMDLRMPRMGGLEASRRIRELPGARGRVPIVAMTADLAAALEDVLGAAGIQGVLAKPFTSRELLAAVAEAAARADAAAPAQGSMQARVLDPVVLGQLTRRMGADGAEAHLRSFAERLRTLIALLHHPADNPSLLAELRHELQGGAGLLGLLPLGEALRVYAQSSGADPGDVTALLGIAEASLSALSTQLVAADGSSDTHRPEMA